MKKKSLVIIETDLHKANNGSAEHEILDSSKDGFPYGVVRLIVDIDKFEQYGDENECIGYEHIEWAESPNTLKDPNRNCLKPSDAIYVLTKIGFDYLEEYFEGDECGEGRKIYEPANFDHDTLISEWEILTTTSSFSRMM